MAIAQLFRSETRAVLEKLQARSYANSEEKHRLLEELCAARDLKTVEAVRLLFSPDGDLRATVGKLLAARRDAETVPHFLAATSGRPEVARRAAIVALAKSGYAGLAAELGRALERGEGQQAVAASEAILDLPLTGESVPLLARVAERGEAGHRHKAVTRLASVATDAYVPFFERMLQDGDERIRLAAYEVIIRFATPDRVGLLLARLPEEPFGTQQVLIGGIQKLAPAAGEGIIEPVLALLASGNNALRSAALQILLSLPDRVGMVRRFIAYSRGLAGWVRDRALVSMREFGSEVVGPALDLLDDPDVEVRSTALSILASFDDPRVGAGAIRLLADPDWWLAINAADLIGRLKDARAIPALVHAIDREDVRWAAVDALGRIGGPQAVQALAARVIDPRPEIRIEAMAALALNADPAVTQVLRAVADGDALKSVRARAIELLHERGAAAGAPAEAESRHEDLQAEAPRIHHLLAETRRQGASDLHVSVGSPPMLRIHGTMIRLEGWGTLTPFESEDLLDPLLTDAQRGRLPEDKQLDACFYVENDGRYRGNLFIDRRGLNAIFRVIPDRPPNLADLGLPPDVSEIATFHQGMVIVTGPSGSGKSTTLAALVNLINETRRSHILTLEDPVEFVHPFKNSLVNQREVGKHSQSFARALRGALREDPDVIVIGELRDAETVTLALTAAETGHLVLTTLNATTAGKAVDRVVSAFPADEQSQVRESFAGSLKLVIAQALVPSVHGRGRVGCFEILKSTHAVASVIRDNKTFQIPSLIQIGHNLGMRGMDDSLLQLVREGKVAPETAYLRAINKETFAPLVAPRFLEELLA